jgi:hypothetical protein
MGPSKGPFDSAQVALCEKAIGLAWAALQDSPWGNAAPARDKEMRTILARTIFEQVADGETDPHQLRTLAMEALFLDEATGGLLSPGKKPTPPRDKI